MELALTAKVRLIFQNHDDIISMKKTMDRYRQACNVASQFIFDFIPESKNGMSLPNIPTIFRLNTLVNDVSCVVV